LRIEVTKASRLAIHAIEAKGGSINTVFHTRQGLMQLMAPHSVDIHRPFERPVRARDWIYYTDRAHRGYLSHRKEYDELFKPRGYLGDDQSVKDIPNPLLIRVNYLLSEEDRAELAALKTEAAERLTQHEQTNSEHQRLRAEGFDPLTGEPRNRRGHWFKEQSGDWKWLDVNKETGALVTDFGPRRDKTLSEIRAIRDSFRALGPGFVEPNKDAAAA
jgi:hypothetical protein